MKTRREFVRSSAMAGAGLMWSAPRPPAKLPRFPDGDPKWGRTWDAALAVLAGNVKRVAKYDRPVLFEGAVYPGVWQECGPQEGLIYATLREFVAEERTTALDAARANHMAFFALQREDGQLPASIKLNEAGFAQIQMVVPIAATAWELVQLSMDEALLAAAYSACTRWDAWLRKYRNTRGTGLVEGFCTYDTGHDNSPRWKGMPNRCADGDARKCPAVEGLPRLCPDLSATMFGGRVALAAMAQALGKRDEAARWQEDAETLRKLILAKLYCAEEAAFYDLDAQGKFVRVRSDVISRVMGEHVLRLKVPAEKEIFDNVWARQLHSPSAFWAPFPLPSVAMDDPAFVRPIPRNSWGGATQALTALRAPRWMEHYGKGAELRILLQAWVHAIADSGGFWQQMDPVSGEFTKTDASGYSPCALVYLDFIRRLSQGNRARA